MKTNKYNKMIESFACDFALACEGKHSLEELQNKINNITGKENNQLAKDIYLLCQLDYMLRSGAAEIHIVEQKNMSMKQNIAREIVASLSSLYPLTEIEEEALNTLLESKGTLWNPESESDMCPNCGRGHIRHAQKFCDECGQPLLLD